MVLLGLLSPFPFGRQHVHRTHFLQILEQAGNHCRPVEGSEPPKDFWQRVYEIDLSRCWRYFPMIFVVQLARDLDTLSSAAVV